MAELVKALKSAGGVAEAPGADKNADFLRLLDSHLPELKIYCVGKIQTSPGVEEIEGSPTEYYRTVGAMIAMLGTYAYSVGDSFGLDCVAKGSRGPMSMDKVPGKFINMGNKPKEFQSFCDTFAKFMATEEDWWGMLVFLAVHDVGKSDAFRKSVNATLPVAKQTDDHDLALYYALTNNELKERFLPSVAKLSPKRQEMLAAGFATNFQLPQLGQGELAPSGLRGLIDMPKEQLEDGTLSCYLYHSIFDIAGASCNEKFIYPLALVPVFMGFSTAMADLMQKLKESTKPDERSLYFDFLYSGFQLAYPEFEENVFKPLCDSKLFREEAGLVVLRILALTRNTYKNPQQVLDMMEAFPTLVQEMAGRPCPHGPQIMLYYAPDMLRMGLGDDLVDESGGNMYNALAAMDKLYRLARETVRAGDAQYQLNVQPAVTAIKNAGKAWSGGKQLKDMCSRFVIESNQMKTEGILVESELDQAHTFESECENY